MRRPTTQTLEMPLLPTSKKKSKPLSASKRDDWPSLVASSNFFLLLQKPPTPLSTPYLFTFCHQNIIKKTINPWENYYSRPSFTKSTSLPTTIVEKKKKWMVLFITYLCPSLQKKERKKQGQVHQTNAVKAELPNWLAAPILCVSTVQHRSRQHFLNFSSKHHYQQYKLQILVWRRNQLHQKNSSKCTEMKEKMVEGTPQLLLQQKTRM